MLLCRVAWADGVVRAEERAVVHELARRFASGIPILEIDAWLEQGPPEAEIEALPSSLGEMFFYDAFRVMEADGELHDAELAMLDTIMTKVFGAHPRGTSLAKIALARRRVDD